MAGRWFRRRAGTQAARFAETACRMLLALGLGLATMASGAERDTAPHRLEITTHLGDGQVFQEGDVVNFLVSSNRDAYLLIVYEDAAHRLVQLLPNPFSGNNYYRAGEFISVPGERAPFTFTISEPFGQEVIWAFSSDRPFPQLPGHSLENGLKQIDGDVVGMQRALNHASRADGPEIVTASLEIVTRAKPQF